MYTDIIIKVDKDLKGSLDDQEIRVCTLGGEDDTVAIVLRMNHLSKRMREFYCIFEMIHIPHLRTLARSTIL